ncbi:hypothetical protein I1E95_02115 [Synechococcus sp. CBW1107]|uniref:hypothetical protein n=1 Tax=Synechococcus sp. CBW1107 TaxID=2789857 RepID=UPI0018CE1984|nr:hypothetical protein [Synechococcus sp. CBW1107]QPN56996.1 hypothetical protein I1E95_02115 [Synechococcus sp. CBW1107]
MSFQQELDLCLRARFTLIVLITPEEERAVAEVRKACETNKRPCLSWDAGDGFEAIANWTGSVPTAPDPKTALEKIDQHDGDALFILRDFHDIWSNAQLKRKLRNLAQRFRYTRKSILITTPSPKLPAELKDVAVVVEFPPPDTAELETVLNGLTTTPGVQVQLGSAPPSGVTQEVL